MIPTELKMEDISTLGKLLPSELLNLVFAQSDKNIERKTALYRKIYIRLLDKALDEYEESRNLIVTQIKEGKRSEQEMTENGRFIYMFKFVDQMENCITTVRRILRLLDRLKRNAQRLSFTQIILKQIESLTTPLVGLRNTVEHIEKEIKKDGIQKNKPVMLKISENQNGIVIGSQHLSFSDLSTLIKRLHKLGEEMIAWRVDEDAESQHA